MWRCHQMVPMDTKKQDKINKTWIQLLRTPAQVYIWLEALGPCSYSDLQLSWNIDFVILLVPGGPVQRIESIIDLDPITALQHKWPPIQALSNYCNPSFNGLKSPVILRLLTGFRFNLTVSKRLMRTILSEMPYIKSGPKVEISLFKYVLTNAIASCTGRKDKGQPQWGCSHGFVPSLWGQVFISIVAVGDFIFFSCRVS